MKPRDITYLDCPAWLDDSGRERCGLPATIDVRYVMDSTDGPLECAMISCPHGHRFNGPIEFLTFTAPARAGSGQITQV